MFGQFWCRFGGHLSSFARIACSAAAAETIAGAPKSFASVAAVAVATTRQTRAPIASPGLVPAASDTIRRLVGRVYNANRRTDGYEASSQSARPNEAGAGAESGRARRAVIKKGGAIWNSWRPPKRLWQIGSACGATQSANSLDAFLLCQMNRFKASLLAR